MHTTVSFDTLVVNSFARDYCGRRGQNRAVSTLLERIEWLVAEKASGNKRKLARMAELSESHVTTILSRLRKNPEKDVERQTLIALANATNVNLLWLSTGEGEVSQEAEASPVTPDIYLSDPKLGNLPDWPRLLKDAKILAPELPSDIWDTVRDSRPLATVPVTAAMLADLARLVFKYRGSSPPK